MTASSEGDTGNSLGAFSNLYGDAWHAADDSSFTEWHTINATPPHWLLVDFGVGASIKVNTLSIQAPHIAQGGGVAAPKVFVLQTNTTDDQGDTGTWTNQITVGRDGEAVFGEQTGWAASETRTFSDTGYDSQTGYRYWRLYVDEANPGDNGKVTVGEIKLVDDPTTDTGQVYFTGNSVSLNAGAIGSLARIRKEVEVSDTGTEHSLDIHISQGPVTMRVGSTLGDDDYINETALGEGYHNLAFTPFGNFHITLQNDKDIDKIVSSMAIGDSGTVEVVAPWEATDLDNIRYDQSADVVYIDCLGVHPYKIERRGTGRSWSIVKYQPNLGPFLGKTASAKLNVGALFGNTTMTSDLPVFKSSHVGALFRLTNDGQSGTFNLGTKDAATDSFKVTGISDTGIKTTKSERRITFDVSGTYDGQITIERSFDDPDYGFHEITDNFVPGGFGTSTDTGTFSTVIEDNDDNVVVWYRAMRTDTGIGSGTAVVKVTLESGLTTGIARALTYNSNTSMDIEVLRRFSDTGKTGDWEEGSWSSVRGYPSVPALHEGRLAHAGKANIWISVADDYENFDSDVEGESAPINRTLGSGPVDNIYGMVSLSRLIAGTAGSEIVIKSSSLEEPLTRVNASARAFSTQGVSNVRILPVDSRGIFVQRSKQRVYSMAFGQSLEAANEYESTELTVLVPELLSSGVVSMAVQRQPDTRFHFVLANGKVAILTYEPREEVLAWSLWETDGSVERAMVLPGVIEDKVFYHVNRTIDGSTKRYLEQWAREDECQGDTGLSWLADCAVSYTDTGRVDLIPGFGHLAGESIIGWANDTGQGNNFGKDLSPDDTGMNQTTYYVNTASDTGDTGKLFLSEAIHHFVGGLPYTANFKSTKLAYAAQRGTALAQLKRGDKIGFVMNQVHNNGLYFGTDTGDLDPLPRVIDADTGEAVDANKIFTSFDQVAMPFPGLWDTDSRMYLRGKAPRPIIVMAAVPTVITHEK
jgi:hypothetical protein